VLISLSESLAALPAVQRVRLRGCPIGDEGSAAIVRAAARPGSCINALDLSRAGIGPRGASAVAGYVSVCPSLRMLNLEENPMGAGAAGALAAAAFATEKLEVLGLAHTGLGDAGAKQLLAVFRPPAGGLGLPPDAAPVDAGGEAGIVGGMGGGVVALKLLDLSFNALGAAAAEQAAVAFTSPRCGLTELLLSGNPLGRQGTTRVL